MKKLFVASAIAFLGTAGVANAAAVQYGANGHWYEYIEAYNISWNDARTTAASLTYSGMSGHLATIADAGENAFLFGFGNSYGYLGATDQVAEGNWQWVTGEAWSYTNWAGGEPNNCCSALWNNYQGEDYLMFWGGLGEWNDIFNDTSNNTSGWGVPGYYVEYESASAVPLPAAVWLFGSALLSVFGVSRRKSGSAMAVTA